MGTCIFWRCRYKDSCKARIHTSIETSEVINKINEHTTHDSEAAKIEANVAVTKMKKRARENLEPTSNVINECTSGLSQAAKGVLTSDGALKKQIRRARRAIQAAPDAPKDLETLIIPEEYRIYSPSVRITDTFLLCDSGPGVDRILIFGRPRSLDILYNSTTWYVDGTFKVAPLLFAQVYVILGKYLNGVHPLIYALLPNKTYQTYERLFKLILDLKPELKPTSISCDFEQAAIKAIHKYFPQSEINGCLFHLTKNFRSQMCELDLLSQYNNSSEFSLYVKMILALAFVKIGYIEQCVKILYDEVPEEILPLLDWFEENYIGRVYRGRRRNARFPPNLWNVHEQVLNNIDRTNNHAEAANRRLNVQMGVTHPTIWAFIECLRKIQSGRDTYYCQLEAGKSPPKKQKNVLTLISEYSK